MALKHNEDISRKAPALAEEFSAVRGELPASITGRNGSLDHENDDAQIGEDLTLTPNGHRHMSKVAFSARYDAVQSQEANLQKLADKEKSERALRAARQAAWDATKIVLGGVEMTNAEAQEARRHILERREEYIRRAVQNGEMSKEQAERVMRGIRREYEWGEKERNGTLTDADRAQRKEWRGSRDCAEADRLTAETVQHQRAEIGGSKVSAENKVDADSLFPNAPDMGGSFAQATTGTVPALDTEKPAPAAPVPGLQQPGLGL